MITNRKVGILTTAIQKCVHVCCDMHRLVNPRSASLILHNKSIKLIFKIKILRIKFLFQQFSANKIKILKDIYNLRIIKYLRITIRIVQEIYEKSIKLYRNTKIT